MSNDQKEFHAYKDGNYVGMFVATEEQFAETGYTIGLAPDPIITNDLVNVEAKRRIHELVGAKNDQESNEKQANLQVEYMAILDTLMSGDTLTDEQTQRRAIIKGGNDQIKQIRAFSNDLIAMAVIPPDYVDDKHWPDAV